MDIIFQRITICADIHNVLKVKQKGRKNSKKGTKTRLLNLARAESNYEFTKPLPNVSVNDREGLKDLQGDKSNIVGFTANLTPNRKVSTRVDIGEADKATFENVNHLLRQILMFSHGNNLAHIYKVRKLAQKPIQLNVLTKVYPLYLIDKSKPIAEQDRKILYLHDLTIRNVWQHTDKGLTSYDILFDSKTCKTVQIWLNSLTNFY